MTEGGGLDETTASHGVDDEPIAPLLSTAAETLDGVALLYARADAVEPFVAVARAERPPATPETPPNQAVPVPGLLQRLTVAGAALVAPSRKDPLRALDPATVALLEAEGAASLMLAALGDEQWIDSAIVIVDAQRPRPYGARDAEVLGAMALTLAPAARRARHELLYRSERHRRRAAEARILGTIRIVEVLGEQLAGAVLAYRDDGRCTLAAGPALRRLVRGPDPVGRLIADVLVPEPQLLGALARAEQGEPGAVVVELGAEWFDVRFAPQLRDDGVVVGGLVVATDATTTTNSLDALRESAGEAEAESEQRALALDRLVAAEQQREAALTSAIHDDVLQMLSALGWRLDALAGRLEGKGADEARTLAGQVREAGQRLGAALGDVGGEAEDGDQLVDLAGALEHKLDAAGFDESVERRVVDELGAGLAAEIAEVLVAIAGEAIANAAQHAGATYVEIVVRPEEAGTAVVVQDDGRGFDTSQVGRRLRNRGIALMRERARTGGGWVRVESRAGRGTTIHAWVPRS